MSQVLARRRIMQIVRAFLCFMLIIALFSGCATAPPEKKAIDLFWPPPPETPRIKWLTSWSSRYDFGRPNPLFSLLVGEERVEKLRRPTGVVADSAGNIFVTDPEVGVVFVFDIEKQGLRFLGAGTLSRPTGIAIDNKRGIVFVSDSKTKRIYGFDKDADRVILELGAPNEWRNPAGMVYDEERERLYVADSQNHIIKVFDRNGKKLFTIGKRGPGDGEFNFPTYLALDKKGRLYVMDTLNFRIQIFDSEGNFIKKFGRLGDVSGTFTRPHGIGVDSEGHVYVVDTAFQNFQIFDEDGTLLLWVGHVGRKEGEFYLPMGMYIDREDRIYICDTFNARVQVFQYLKEGK
jgi:DNA-binding beta-propeller fold protein YncE